MEINDGAFGSKDVKIIQVAIIKATAVMEEL